MLTSELAALQAASGTRHCDPCGLHGRPAFPGKTAGGTRRAQTTCDAPCTRRKRDLHMQRANVPLVRRASVLHVRTGPPLRRCEHPLRPTSESSPIGEMPTLHPAHPELHHAIAPAIQTDSDATLRGRARLRKYACKVW